MADGGVGGGGSAACEYDPGTIPPPRDARMLQHLDHGAAGGFAPAAPAAAHPRLACRDSGIAIGWSGGPGHDKPETSTGDIGAAGGYEMWGGDHEGGELSGRGSGGGGGGVHGGGTGAAAGWTNRYEWEWEGAGPGPADHDPFRQEW